MTCCFSKSCSGERPVQKEVLQADHTTYSTWWSFDVTLGRMLTARVEITHTQWTCNSERKSGLNQNVSAQPELSSPSNATANIGPSSRIQPMQFSDWSELIPWFPNSDSNDPSTSIKNLSGPDGPGSHHCRSSTSSSESENDMALNRFAGCSILLILLPRANWMTTDRLATQQNVYAKKIEKERWN